jgi:hypothetical protein
LKSPRCQSLSVHVRTRISGPQRKPAKPGQEG